MTASSTATASASASANRDLREVIREEPVVRTRILAALDGGPLTVPEIAAAIDAPAHEVVLWVMAMRRYGWVVEVKGSADDGYFRYERTGRAS